MGLAGVSFGLGREAAQSSSYGVPYLKIVVETPLAIVVVPWPKSRLAMLPRST